MSSAAASPGPREGGEDAPSPARRLHDASASMARDAAAMGKDLFTKLELNLRRASNASGGVSHRIPLAVAAAVATLLLARRAGQSAIRTATTVVATAYPAYMSFKSLSTSDDTQRRRLLMYWVCYAILRNIEASFEGLISWIPNYSASKVALLLWLQKSGAPLLYSALVHPVLSANQKRIDGALKKANKQFEILTAEWEMLRMVVARKVRGLVDNEWARGTV